MRMYTTYMWVRRKSYIFLRVEFKWQNHWASMKLVIFNEESNRRVAKNYHFLECYARNKRSFTVGFNKISWLNESLMVKHQNMQGRHLHATSCIHNYLTIFRDSKNIVKNEESRGGILRFFNKKNHWMCKTRDLTPKNISFHQGSNLLWILSWGSKNFEFL